MIRRPILFMRKKNLLGTYFSKYAGFSRTVRSVGGAVEKGIITPPTPE